MYPATNGLGSIHPVNMPDLSEEQAALYALGLLEPAEAASFEARLGSDPSLAGLAREFCEVQALVLAFVARRASYDPSPAVKRNILARIDTARLK